MRLDIRGEYPDNWREIAAAAKAAAGYRCVRCGHPFHEDGTPALCDAKCDDTRGLHATRGHVTVHHAERLEGINYTVHHLDGDKSNCRWWNLLATCNSCHLSVQARVIPERPWLFDHSAWFRPFVAGYYAWYYAGLEITRAEAERATDRYLALGQPWLASASPTVAADMVDLAQATGIEVVE